MWLVYCCDRKKKKNIYIHVWTKPKNLIWCRPDNIFWSKKKFLWRANTQNVSFFYPLWCLIYVFNPVVNTKLPAIPSHRRSTTVSLETYPFIYYFPLHLYSLLIFRHIGKDISNTFAKLEKLAICKFEGNFFHHFYFNLFQSNDIQNMHVHCT